MSKLLDIAVAALERNFKNTGYEDEGHSDIHGNPFEAIHLGFSPVGGEPLEEAEFVLIASWFARANEQADKTKRWSLVWRLRPEIVWDQNFGMNVIRSRQSMS